MFRGRRAVRLRCGLSEGFNAWWLWSAFLHQETSFTPQKGVLEGQSEPSFHLLCSPFPPVLAALARSRRSLPPSQLPPPPPLHCFLSSLFFFSCQIFKQRFPFGWCAKQHSSSFTLSPLKIKRLTSISITKEETGSFCLRFQSVAVFLSFTPEEEKSCYYSKRN